MNSIHRTLRAARYPLPAARCTLHAARCTLLLMLLASPVAAQYADSATAALVRSARERHLTLESRLRGYRAEVHTRMDGAAGAGRFARALRLFAYESKARVHWERPNDLRVDLQGMRTRSFRLPGVSARDVAGFWTEVFSSEPWFVPRTLGEEIQILGVPDEPAIHPLARDAERYYRYALVDSVTLVLPERSVRAVAVRVEPTVYGPMLVSGQMWLDADSLDVVRLTVAFVGERLWEDEEDSPTMEQLEADLEYGLHLGQYWLPRQQILSAAWSYKYLPGATLTSTAVSTFEDYDIEPSADLAFRREPPVSHRTVRLWNCDFAGDGRPGYRCGDRGMHAADEWEDGRWEINVPPLDTLVAFDFGGDFRVHEDLLNEELLAQRVTEMAEFSEALPYAWTGKRWLDLDWTQSLRYVGFNRVHGLSVALGTSVRTGIAFTTVNLTGRFGTADERLTGAVSLRRAAPRGRLEIGAFRQLRDVEPWTEGLGIGNTAKALVLGHDDADYYLATGGFVSYRGFRGKLRDVEVSFAVERQRSVVREAGSALHDVLFGDGVFQPNPAVVEGDFVRVTARHRILLGPATAEIGTGALMGEGILAGRSWGAVAVALPTPRAGGTLHVRGGSVYGDRVPQFDFRLGGPATVRGFQYGQVRGAAFWAAQLDVHLIDNEWAAPVVFADAGSLFDGGDALVGAGVGVSLFKGWMRIDLAKGLRPAVPVRVDVTFRAPE